MEYWWNDTDRVTPLLVPLCSPQIPRVVAWDQTWALSVKNCQLTAWTFARTELIFWHQLMHSLPRWPNVWKWPSGSKVHHRQLVRFSCGSSIGSHKVKTCSHNLITSPTRITGARVHIICPENSYREMSLLIRNEISLLFNNRIHMTIATTFWEMDSFFLVYHVCLLIRLAVKRISKIQQPYGLIKQQSSYTGLGRLCERINTIDPNKHGVDQI